LVKNFASPASRVCEAILPKQELKMKHSERFALNQWLFEHPEDATYDEVLKMIHQEDERVTVWETLEGHPSDVIANTIEDTKLAVEQMLDNLLCGIALRNKTEEESIAEGAMV
jgi:hypothetical protein